jgi:tRNA pseudouridine-54 N-methylase
MGLLLLPLLNPVYMKTVIADTPREQEIQDLQTTRFTLQKALEAHECPSEYVNLAGVAAHLKEVKQKLNHYYIHEKGLGR